MQSLDAFDGIGTSSLPNALEHALSVPLPEKIDGSPAQPQEVAAEDSTYINIEGSTEQENTPNTTSILTDTGSEPEVEVRRSTRERRATTVKYKGFQVR